MLDKEFLHKFFEIFDLLIKIDNKNLSKYMATLKFENNKKDYDQCKFSRFIVSLKQEVFVIWDYLSKELSDKNVLCKKVADIVQFSDNQKINKRPYYLALLNFFNHFRDVKNADLKWSSSKRQKVEGVLSFGKYTDQEIVDCQIMYDFNILNFNTSIFWLHGFLKSNSFKKQLANYNQIFKVRELQITKKIQEMVKGEKRICANTIVLCFEMNEWTTGFDNSKILMNDIVIPYLKNTYASSEIEEKYLYSWHYKCYLDDKKPQIKMSIKVYVLFVELIKEEELDQNINQLTRVFLTSTPAIKEYYDFISKVNENLKIKIDAYNQEYSQNCEVHFSQNDGVFKKTEFIHNLNGFSWFLPNYDKTNKQQLFGIGYL